PGFRADLSASPLRNGHIVLGLSDPWKSAFKAGDRPQGVGDWVLEELLGVGGFGEVWRATNAHLGETAALKFCLDEESARLLRNEAALLRRVKKESEGQHRGIVPLQDANLDSTAEPWLRYEYVAGGNLTSLVQEWQALRAPERVGKIVACLHSLAATVG